MQVTVLFVGSSLLAPLKNAERELNRTYKLDLSIKAYNFGLPFDDDGWRGVEQDLNESDVLFVIHVMDGENASRLITHLDHHRDDRTVVVINCMPELMRRTRMGKLDAARLFKSRGNGEKEKRGTDQDPSGTSLIGGVGSWVGRQARSKSHKNGNGNGHGKYLKYVDRLPRLLRLVPNAGKLRDVKNYLNIFCYFVQPTPANVQSMILVALKEYVRDPRLDAVAIGSAPAEQVASVAIYHPDANSLFETFDEYRDWYVTRPKSELQSPKSFSTRSDEDQEPKAEDRRPTTLDLDPQRTIGLLLMRPQVVSKTTKHYNALIRAIEAEGLSVIPALSTLMDNRQAVNRFFVNEEQSKVQTRSKVKSKNNRQRTTDNAQPTTNYQSLKAHTRVSQIVSLTGFSFVGGPAMNDSEAAAEFLKTLNRPYRSAVSLDTQTIDAWRASPTGLNPVQAGMQIAIPEIDGATEPYIYGGIPSNGVEPVALAERCTRFALRLRRWNHLRTTKREEIKLAFVLYCFPPNKGNIGTAADLDVFSSVIDTLQQLKAEGYEVDVPPSAEEFREMIIGGNAAQFGSVANVAYAMPIDEYRRLCPYVNEVTGEWGEPPGNVNTDGYNLLIQGVQFGKVFIGVQPTFGYEGDPMRLMMARGGAPHHGFTAFYTYLSRVLDVDAVVHVGTHGAMEFMPGKQVGLSEDCWPDRLIGELPNIYIYSVNNPSEGSIAKRRSYAELISYLTPPIQNAGLYKDLSTLKQLVESYRQASSEAEQASLFASIEEVARQSHLSL